MKQPIIDVFIVFFPCPFFSRFFLLCCVVLVGVGGGGGGGGVLITFARYNAQNFANTSNLLDNP